MKAGDKVTYSPRGSSTFQHGIIKSLSDTGHVLVVYNCNKDWAKYQDYTAARTSVLDLLKGWV